MIDEQKTLEIYGYTSDELKPQSGKPIVAVCEGCGVYRTLRKHGYKDLCRLCAILKVTKGNKGKPCSEETKLKLSEAHKGKKLSEDHKRKLSEAHKGKKRKPHTKETKLKMSEASKGILKSEDHKRKMSDTRKGKNNHNFGKPMSDKQKIKISKANKNPSEETLRKRSAAMQGISIDEWQGYAVEKKYCEKFDDECRERNRKKYGNQCFICGKTKEDNGNRRLSVHHIDKNKNQGCDSIDWSLVPLCAKHHATCHNDLWEARINYLLNHVWLHV